MKINVMNVLGALFVILIMVSAQGDLGDQTESDGSAVILITTENYPDAMVAGAAANKEGYPLLFTDKEAIPNETLAEIENLQPATIYIIGGPAVISEEIEEELSENYEVVRVWGMTRYGTAADVPPRIA